MCRPLDTAAPRLRLYLAVGSPTAERALDSRQRLIEAFGGGIEIEVVDILRRPSEAATAGILATPTLSDECARPPRRLIGDFSEVDKVLAYFRVQSAAGQ